MGYYSIYRIIKDMIRVLLGKKILRWFVLILFMTLVLLFLDRNGVFASSDIIYHVDYLDADVTLPSWLNNDYYYFFSVKYSGGYTYIKLVASKNEFTLTKSGNNYNMSGNGVYNFSLNRGSRADINYIQNQLDSLVEPTSPDYLTNSGLVTYVNETNYLANFDIKNTSGVVVFSSNVVPPYVSPIFYNKSGFINFTDNSLVIYPNDYGVDTSLYLHFLKVDSIIQSDNISTYYYSETTFNLNRNSKYYNIDEETLFHYYIIPSSVFSLEGGKQYIFFLNDSSEPINNSNGIYNFSNDFDGFYLNPSSTDITPQDTIIDNQQNQNDKLDDIAGFLNSDSYDQEKIDNSLDGLSSSTEDIDDSEYTGLFSAIFGRFSNIVNGDFSTVEEIRYPIPNTDKYIVITSDILSSKIQNTFIYTFLQVVWYFIFGTYIFKFSNNLIRKIKDGSILNGYENNNEVITSTML